MVLERSSIGLEIMQYVMGQRLADPQAHERGSAHLSRTPENRPLSRSGLSGFLGEDEDSMVMIRYFPTSSPSRSTIRR